MSLKAGEPVKILWALDNQIHTCQITFNTEDGRPFLFLSDVKTKKLDRTHENWSYKKQSLDASVFSILRTLESSEHEIIPEMMYVYGQNPFLWNVAQGFDHRSSRSGPFGKRSRSFLSMTRAARQSTEMLQRVLDKRHQNQDGNSGKDGRTHMMGCQRYSYFKA